MAKNSVNIAPIIKVSPPPLRPEQRYPAGAKIYAILRGGKEDGSIVEAEVRGHDENSVTIVYTREDGVSAIERVSLLDISARKAELEKIIHPARQSINETVRKMPAIPIGRIEDIGNVIEMYSIKPEILNGNGAESLEDSIKVFRLSTGDIAAAATDKGINYKKRNEDRVLVNPESGEFAVIDGMGGHSDGDKAAQIFAETVMAFPGNIDQSVNNAGRRLNLAEADGTIKEDAGACFVHGKIAMEKGSKLLYPSQMGDAKIIVYNAQGEIVFKSKDESFVQQLVYEKKITEDQALYHDQRNIITNAMKANADKDDIKKYAPVELKRGYKIVAVSDGIADNITPEEMWLIIKGKNAEKAVVAISDVTDERMKNAAQIFVSTSQQGGRSKLATYSDGFKSEPKPDNRGITIIDVI